MSREPSIEKLESLCQHTLQQLLNYKENLQKCKNHPYKAFVHPIQSLSLSKVQNSVKAVLAFVWKGIQKFICYNAPAKGQFKNDYKSLLLLYQKLKYKEILLLEIKEQIKQKQHEKELKNASQLAAVLFGDSTNKQKNPLEKWYAEMITYCHELNADIPTRLVTEDRIFYNVSYSASIQSIEQGELSKLSFSTRCCRKCLMITVAVKHKNDDDFEIVDCQSSLGFEGLDNSLDEALRKKQSAKDFVKLFLWKNIKILNDYCNA